MTHGFEKAVLGLFAVTLGMPAVQAQDAMQPSFSVIGHIEAMTLDTPGSASSGAQITVSNIPVTIPANSLITMPGKYITLQDLFRGPVRATPGSVPAVGVNSGLALLDPTPPKVPFEAEIIGNIDKTTGRFIAANVHISQGALHTGAGFIQAINTQTGELRVGAKGGTVGARVRLNDVQGVFGLKNSDRPDAAMVKLDERFELDSGNAPVHAKTGYPVCIPRSLADPLCPATNRPGPSATNPTLNARFTCGPVAAAVDVPTFATCNPSLAAPLQVGDYVTYAGVLTMDTSAAPGTNPFVVAAYGLDAELGIYTSPNTEPVYVFIEEAIQGTKGEPFRTDPTFGDIAQEETTRFRVVGFTTDPSRNVEVGILDSDRFDQVDPATPGFSRFSFTGSVGLRPSNLVQLGRFRFTWPSKDNARAARRDAYASVVGSAHATVMPQGFLKSGTYLAPIGEYIYPEVTSFGLPGFPSPMATENFCYLTNAGGVFPTEPGPPVTLAALAPSPLSGHALSQQIGSGPARVCDGQ